VDPDGKIWLYTYDTDGDQQTSTDPLGDQSSKSYNADGWVTASVSPKGNVSGCGCAAKYTRPTVTPIPPPEPSTSSATCVWSPTPSATRLPTVTTRPQPDHRQGRHGHTTTYTFDLDNEVTKTKRPDSTTLLTDYNPDGTVLDQKDGKGNAILTFGYDPLARLTSQTDASTTSPNSRTTAPAIN